MEYGLVVCFLEAVLAHLLRICFEGLKEFWQLFQNVYNTVSRSIILCVCVCV